MSKINAVRLINLNYNNNAVKISDETFYMNGQSTLISLRNGGGKTVLVQMMMAPFVHKRYRDLKDRPFESYFTTNKPTFILVEWQLDQGAGYVLTGLMVRKNQEPSDEEAGQEKLEIIGVISEYKDRCTYDIHSLPVVEKTKKEMTLKNFGACRQLFESYKRDRSIEFYYYDINNSSQSRQYFDKLMEYQIHYKEWEAIIKKVNLKESGLSDLFSDCRDEKGLVEKWFLDAVESKLNKEKNRMKEFQAIIEKYIGQYKENCSKIERRDTIRRFREEGENIRAEATSFHEASLKAGQWENRIAGLIKELNRLRDHEEALRSMVHSEIEEIGRRKDWLNYEKLSGEIYKLKQEERFHSSNRDMIDMERESLEREAADIRKKLHLLECARRQAQVDEDKRSLVNARQKLDIYRQKGEALEPERRRLGGGLRLYYEDLRSLWQNKMQENQDGIRKSEESLEQEQEKRELLQEQIVESTALIAGQKAKTGAFDHQENRFNRQYRENLARNILGEYEPGALEIKMESYVKEQEELSRTRIYARKQMEQWTEERKSKGRELEDLKEELAREEGKAQEAQRVRAQFEQELLERKTVLRYLEMEEGLVFDTHKILAASDRKLKELELARRRMEQEEDKLKKEHERLSQGKVLELPGEFALMLENLGIHYVYGMEWLKNNGRSVEENSRLSEQHPFLPYALILSEKELEKLEDHGKKEGSEEVYTSFPIPIIPREQLEEGDGKRDKTIISYEQVRFYVYFNQNLLDEEALRQMVREKEKQIERLSGTIVHKQEEYRGYFERQEKIRNQKVTAEAWKENEETVLRIASGISRLTAADGKAREELTVLEGQLENQQKRIMKLEQDTERQNAKLEDFKEFCLDYEVYLEGRRTLEREKRREQRLVEQKRLNEEKLDRLQNGLVSLKHDTQNISDRLKEIQKKYVQYEEFKETYRSPEEGNKPNRQQGAAEREKIQPEPAEEMEARFGAITSGLSLERRELERLAADCRKRYDGSREELAYLQQKYHLDQDAWRPLSYNREEERHQETLLEDRERKKRLKDVQWNEEDKKTAVIREQITEKYRKLRQECGKEEPLSESQIITEDFLAQINQLDYEEKEKKGQEETHVRKINGYEGNLTSLSEYAYLEQKEEVEWQQDLSLMSRKQLDTFKGEMVRDYRCSLEEARECRGRLVQLLNRILRMEPFQEDFYRKPLEALLELSKDATQVLSQLDITLMSYQSLMDKLDVDISMIEKEKEKIVELLEDYVKDVHGNLGKIDHNSTISIRQRPVKMLKIQIPDWQENESLYHIRISDFMDEITRNGISRFEKNENAQEYFGTQITTKNLYDTTVGIGNVQIRLYKIEAQREYPITWAEVARNSGGEGFLSAFVILSSLLYYMRRDESDLFADRNEGKVLVMDNPFAQTNASHLLKPLMDMAEKANTQLICLSGLGGDSIYNRFDNIYVLNLIAASLRNGIQYVKTEHVKGAEGETVVASRIEVTEQMELEF